MKENTAQETQPQATHLAFPLASIDALNALMMEMRHKEAMAIHSTLGPGIALALPPEPKPDTTEIDIDTDIKPLKSN